MPQGMPTFLPIKNACMKSLFTQLMISACMLLTGRCLAQISEPRSLRTSQERGEAAPTKSWPKTIYNPGGGYIHIYKPQVESFTGNILKCKTTITLLANGDDDPVVGVAWTTDTVKTDQGKREVTIKSVRVDNLRIAADNPPFTDADVKKALEVCIPKLIHRLPLDRVLASLDRSDEDTKFAGDIGHEQPKLIFRTSPSILVPIDGQPILRENKEWGRDVVVNSPSTIIKDKDGQFYLYAGGKWYMAPAATGPYVYTDKVDRPLRQIGRGLGKAAKKNGGPGAGGPGAAGTAGTAAGGKGKAPVYDIVVSTVPAELIQTDGNPDLEPVATTALRYAANSNNAILMDTATNLYYVLLAGRWYRSDSLSENGQWQYVAADRLPKDFARIPESSPIADVLPSVAGTQAAKDAVMDTQIPQLEKIDRKTTTTEVVYDGAPQFQAIEGTDMEYAVNTCSTVLMTPHDKYYAVDDGVWFTAGSPLGPWTVSTVRPDEMDLVPPDCPVYNARYVDIYHVSNNYVYDGYTPGYLNSYIDNCTVVYGTGFYYQPWRGDFYYPRPWTWGFGMCFDPWYGWGFGMDYDYDLFDCGWGWDAGFGFVWGGGYGGGYGGGSRGIPGIYHSAYPVAGSGRHGRYDRHGGYVVINHGQGPQGQGQRLVNGRAATLPAGAVVGSVVGSDARTGYNGSRTGGYTAVRGVRMQGYAVAAAMRVCAVAVAMRADGRVGRVAAGMGADVRVARVVAAIPAVGM
jgi:hypothetical protein